ncbi:hypothetical protein Sjap_024244 [Stephania japonica]|uniref:Peroxidase n=1 Tax=Stephania japonica TaxID=461633 RepID=A0AAP0EHT9_9MAGN
MGGSVASAQLSPNFYATTCPRALSLIQSLVNATVANETRMGASLLRLHFHDCFGCDASILLRDNATFTGEQSTPPNANSIRGMDVIDNIKAQVERLCPSVVSCADILTLVARDSVVVLGGPSWTVPLGRRDSTSANQTAALVNIPSPALNLSGLVAAFASQGLNARELVALSGAHTIGQARCTAFRNRIYNDTNIDSNFATLRRANCPSAGGDGNLAPLDVNTSTIFDNTYYTNLVGMRGLLHSDQELFNNGSTDAQVTVYNSNVTSFFSDFASAMVKMGNISPLTGSNGQIRTNCSRTN